MKNAIKEFVKSALTLAALIIASVFGISWVMCGYLRVIEVTFELIALAFFITAVQRGIAAIPFKNQIVAMIVDYTILCAIVLGVGVLLKWFSWDNWPMVLLNVGIVYVVAYFLDMIVVKRDVDSINRMLEKRRRNAERTDEELV